MAKDGYITEKGEDFVNKWAKKIKPLLCEKIGDGKVYHCKNKSDHFKESYPWKAEKTKEAKDLEELTRIRTYHTYGYYGFFKPSLAEVIQQIPEELLDQVKYFLVAGPYDCAEMNKNIEALNDGYHVAETILYKNASTKTGTPIKSHLRQENEVENNG
jgi:hypothetical protein